MPPAVAVSVPAKVNLQLAVGPLRPDGYHDLANLFLALDLRDEVVAAPGAGLSLALEGDDLEGVPADRGNLAWRAAALLAERAGVPADAALTIRKRIPVAGGMAGGSADAAAALVACDALWGLGLPQQELLDMAALLGSDVPFALVGGAALGRGRGELLERVRVGSPLRVVLALADGGLSTPAVFRECDRLREGAAVPVPEPSAPLLRALAAGDAAGVGAAVHNDLQEAALALRPALADALAAGRAAGALGALVSGSGPTCAFVVDTEDLGAAVVAAVEEVPGVRRALVTNGPVAGAEVVTG